MDFNLSDEQRQLRESLERLLIDHYGHAKRAEYVGSDAGWSRVMWERFADMGLLGLSVPERFGGFEGSAVDLMLVSEVFGRHLVMEPWFATVVLAGSAIRLAGDEAQSERLLPGIVTGRSLLAWAHDESSIRCDSANVSSVAKGANGRWTLTGTKINVLHGQSAGQFVVSARIAQEDGEGPLALFIVDGDAVGMRRRDYRWVDYTPVSELHFSDVAAEMLGEHRDAAPIAARVCAIAIAAMAGECVGAMETALNLTVDYLKNRQQFGRPLSDNQVLQHCAVDMLIGIEESRSLAYLAACVADEAGTGGGARDIAVAKLIINERARTVGQQAVQLHGGIGMTEEYAVGHYLRRLTVLNVLFGDSAYHLGHLTENVKRA